MPPFSGNIFRQNTELYTISTIMTGGMNLNGLVLTRALERSLIVRLKRSISGTCSSLATMCSLTWTSSARAPRKDSN